MPFIESAAKVMSAQQLAALFQKAEEAGDLIIPDKETFAAIHFWLLCTVAPTSMMDVSNPRRRQPNRTHARLSKKGWRIFVARYGTQSFKPRMARSPEKTLANQTASARRPARRIGPAS
jgi:hypothetical protein